MLPLKEFVMLQCPSKYHIPHKPSLSSWLLGQAVAAGSHVRLNLQTGAREVKLQDEDKFQTNLKGLKKGKRYSVKSRDWETDSTDPIMLRVMTMYSFFFKINF